MANNDKRKKGNKAITAAVIGSIAGAAIGLLLAPKSGRELRQDLNGEARKIGDKAVEIKGKAQSAWHNVENKTQETVEVSKNWIQKGRFFVSSLKKLVYDVRHGAQIKTGSLMAPEDEDGDDLTREI